MMSSLVRSDNDISVRIFSLEKTLAAFFKYGNKIGIETVKEALEMYVEKGKSTPSDFIRFAKNVV